MELKNKIILLNGPSSAGKSSLVKAIQHLDKEL
jgi:chloramphenicol 3-O-phosphotransferase